MSGLVTTEVSERPPFGLRITARCAVVVAFGLARLSPGGLRQVLRFISARARPAGHEQALRARKAVVAASVRCAGPWCLPRSIATALLCRVGGTWPDWHTGVCVEPFRAHAWVVADGQPVGESGAVSLVSFRSVIVVRAVR
ncbi:lasso peptide biosynthesis B2 protein [Streptomyces enissocaesilis]|nr:lasso peptide biosynthesis B2 protein [Streptomyces enissocaesilis]